MKTFHEIRPEYTVDRFVDGSAPTANMNSFQRLTNYIPSKGLVSTRLGIEEIAHTPDTSGTPWSPLTDANVIMWLDCETSPGAFNFGGSACESLDDRILGSDAWIMTAGNTYSADTSQFKENTKSIYIDYFALPGAGLNQGIKIPGTAVESVNFPGMVAGKHSFIMMFWWRASWRDEKTLWFTRHEDSQPGMFKVQIVTAAGVTYKFQGAFANSAGGTTTVSSSWSIANNRWYHISLWSSETVGKVGMVVYDSDADNTASLTGVVPMVCAGKYTAGSTPFFKFGCYRSGRAWFDDIICRVGDYSTQAAFEEQIKRMRNREV